MKQTWQTLNLPKDKMAFPKPITSNMQMHETLPIGATSAAIRVAMDLGKCRRAWADGVDIVRSAAKYTVLFDQYMSWLERSPSRPAAAPPTFLWKDCEGNTIAASNVNFEHAMNHFTMGLIHTFTGNDPSADFETAIAAIERVPVVPGTQYMRYNYRAISHVADIFKRASRIQELTVTESPLDRQTIALSALHAFPQVAGAFAEYAGRVKYTLFQHMMQATMQIHAERDEFADAHAYATILNDTSNMRFFESMAMTARQKLHDIDTFLVELTPTTHAVACPQYMGFDSVSVESECVIPTLTEVPPAPQVQIDSVSSASPQEAAPVDHSMD